MPGSRRWAVWEAETFGEAAIDVTIGDLLDRQAHEHPDREALVYHYPEIGLRLTYARLRVEANRVAKGLLALGVGRGDHVAVLATNVPEWVLLEMAVAKIGAVLVTVNTNFRQAELEYVLRQADVHTLVLMEAHLLVSGGAVIRALAFDPAKMLELIDREKATVLNAVPTMIIAMLREPRGRSGEFGTTSLRAVMTAGAPIPVPLMEQVKAQWGAEPIIMFGMTEASPIVTQTLPEDDFERRSSTVGIPLPHTEVKIVDPDGEVVEVGQPGEILVRGYNVMKGYYRMPEQTAAAIDADGWLHSGDLASMDERGYVRIVGRLKDMIIRGGENIYPAEIEAFLMRHPGIVQAQVVGVPDAYMGEEAVAVLQSKEGATLTEAEVQGYCRANLARPKLPKYVRFVSEYPQTPSGKVKKFELRAAMVAALGLDAGAR